MSGLLRNILAFLLGLLRYGSSSPDQRVAKTFLAGPWDCGIKVLKSDKYLQYAETAQLDYLLKVGKLFTVIRSGAGFVNVAQFIKFSRPVAMFSRVRVETRLVYADAKCAYFSHLFYARGVQAAEVLVKMKFKKGALTVAPATFLQVSFADAPERISRWEAALASGPNT